MGALDNGRETEELADAPREQRQWFGGSSRDLFADLSRQDTPMDSAKGDPRQDLRDAQADEILNGKRFDGRDDALRDFKLDAVSDASARRVGKELAGRVAVSAWNSGDFLERRAMCDDVHSVLAAELAPTSNPPYHEVLPEGSLGSTDEFNNVHYNVDVLNDESPQRAFETLAHEYRHVWQRDVMSGRAQHPEGTKGLTKLVAADAQYEALSPQLTLTRLISSRWTVKDLQDSYTPSI